MTSPDKKQFLHDLLGRYGMSMITTEQFWSQMKSRGYGQDDIDWFLQEHKRQ